MVTDAAGPIDAFISELRCPIERLYYSEEWGNLEPVGAKGLALSRKDENLILCDGPWTDDDFDTEALRCVKKELADESRFYEVWVGPLKQTGALAVLFAEFRRNLGWTESVRRSRRSDTASSTVFQNTGAVWLICRWGNDAPQALKRLILPWRRNVCYPFAARALRSGSASFVSGCSTGPTLPTLLMMMAGFLSLSESMIGNLSLPS